MATPRLVRRIRRFRLWSRLAFGVTAVMVVGMFALALSAINIGPWFQAIAVTVPVMVGIYLRQQATILLDLQEREGDPPEYAKGVTKRTVYLVLLVFSSVAVFGLFAVAIFAEGAYGIVALCLVPLALAGVVIATVGRWRVALATLRASRGQKADEPTDSGGGEGQ